MKVGLWLLFKRFYFDCPRGGSIVFIRDCVKRITYTDYLEVVVALVFGEPLSVFFCADFFLEIVNFTLLVLCR